MEVVIYVLLALLAFAAGAGATYYMLQQRSSAQFRRTKDESDRLLAEAENQRRDAALSAKDEAIRLRTEIDREITQRRKEIERIERRIEQKEETIDRKTTGLEGRETAVRKQEQSLDSARETWEMERNRRSQELEQQHASRLEEVEVLRSQRLKELERVSNLTTEEAKAELVREVEDEARDMAARRLHEIELEMQRRSRPPLAPGAGDHYPAHRLRLRRRVDRLGRPPAQRRHEGPDHRPRRAQHPRPGAGDRRRPDRRRHPGGGHHLRLRSGAPRGGAPGAEQAVAGRPHPSHPHRRGRHQDAAPSSSR